MSEEKVSDQSTVSPDELAAVGANPISASDLTDNGVSDSLQKQDLGFTEDEVRRNLEAIASTGKFWIEWDKLKSMLSFKLKQVLSGYSEGKMPVEEQHSTLGETYLELIQRLDEALLSFDEGPPFTLQRLCEILLTAPSIYPKLRKLALALEKNLLVSSILFTSYGDPSLDPATNYQVVETEVPKKNGEMEKSSNGVDNTVTSGTTTTAAADDDDDTDTDDKTMVDVEMKEEAKDHHHQEEVAKDEEGISPMETEEVATATATAEPFPSPECELKPSSQPIE